MESQHFRRRRITLLSFTFNIITTPMLATLSEAEPVARTPSITQSDATAVERDSLSSEATVLVAEPQPLHKDNLAEISTARWAMIYIYAFIMSYVLIVRVSPYSTQTSKNSLTMQQDVGVYTWRYVTSRLGMKKNDSGVQFPVRIILRRPKAPKRRNVTPDSEKSTETQTSQRQPIPAMLKKLAPAAKAVTNFANRATTNLRRTTVDRVRLNASSNGPRGPELAALRRRLPLTSFQCVRAPGVVGRRTAASDATTSSDGSVSWSASSTSTSSGSRRFFRPFAPARSREMSRGALPSLPGPPPVRQFSFGKPMLEHQPSMTPKEHTPELGSSPPSTVHVDATLVQWSPEGHYDLMRTSIEEAPEEKESDSEDGYTSTEGSLSVDSGSMDFMDDSVDSGPGVEVIGQPTVSGPVGQLRQKLERTITAFHKSELVVG